VKPRAFWKPLDRLELPALKWVEKTRAAGPVEDATKVITRAGEHGLVWYGVAAVAAVVDKPNRGRWLRAGATVAAIYGANTALKFAARRQRPPLASFGTETDLSFPSSHAATSFAAARLFSSIAPGTTPLFYAAALTVTGSRLHFCVHYPSDLLAGAALGDLAARATVRPAHELTDS
jgi:membrane-associated phospholipid phosphatase